MAPTPNGIKANRMRAALRRLQSAGRPMPGAMAAAALAATTGILIGANVVSRDLSVPPPPEVPAVTLPADSPARSPEGGPRVAEAQLAVATPSADAAPAPATVPPPPPAVAPKSAARSAAAAAAPARAAGDGCGEPPGWARDLAAGTRDGRSWAGPCSPGKGERNGWQRHGA